MGWMQKRKALLLHVFYVRNTGPLYQYQQSVSEQITAEWHYLTTKCFHMCEINHMSESCFFLFIY